MLKEIKIEYIYHSAFSIDFEDRLFIFDYYKGNLPKLDKKSTFFVSHSHDDHFSPEILQVENSGSHDYILSSDIINYKKEKNIIDLGDEENVEKLKLLHSENTSYMKPGDYIDKADYSVRTFASTDKGVSFLLNYEGINIFHAGDLNLWIWDEDTDEEREEMYKDFMDIINEISFYNIDLAFFPLDPRLEDKYADGFNIFIDELDPSIIFPMHFKDDISYNLQYMTEFKENNTIFRPIFKNNQTFLVNYEE